MDAQSAVPDIPTRDYFSRRMLLSTTVTLINKTSYMYKILPRRWGVTNDIFIKRGKGFNRSLFPWKVEDN